MESGSKGERWIIERKYKWDFCKLITCSFFTGGYNNITTNPRDAESNGYDVEAVSCNSYNHVKCSASPWGDFYGVWRGSTSAVLL